MWIIRSPNCYNKIDILILKYLNFIGIFNDSSIPIYTDLYIPNECYWLIFFLSNFLSYFLLIKYLMWLFFSLLYCPSSLMIWPWEKNCLLDKLVWRISLTTRKKRQFYKWVHNGKHLLTTTFFIIIFMTWRPSPLSPFVPFSHFSCSRGKVHENLVTSVWNNACEFQINFMSRFSWKCSYEF